MKFTGRNLSYNLSGKDVAALQAALKRLGYELPAEETEAKRFGDATQKAVIAAQRAAALAPDGIVERRTVAAINRALATVVESGKGQYRVSGTVCHPDGSPFAGRVLVYDRDLRKSEKLGEAELDQSGKFAVVYSPQQFVRAEKGAADLAFEVQDAHDQKIEAFQLARRIEAALDSVSEPQVIFQADPDEEVAIIVGKEGYRGSSEYAQLLEMVDPLVADVAGGLAALDPDPVGDDILFLAGETGLDAARIVMLVQAHIAQREYQVPAEAFYGLLREGLPAEIESLGSQDPDVLRRALWSAARKNVIGAQWGDEENINRALTVLRDAFTSHTLRDGNRTGALVKSALPDASLQASFINAYLDHKGSPEEFWQKLRDSAEGDALHPLQAHVDKLQLTLELGALTGLHMPLVQHLKTVAKHKSARELAQYDAAGWQSLMEKNHIAVPEDFEQTAEPAARTKLYAEKLAHQVEDAYPGEFVAHRVIGLAKKQRNLAPLAAFLRRNILDAGPEPRFDLQTGLIESYLKANSIDLDDIAKDELKTLQRLLRIAPRFEQVQTLRAASYHSVYSITQKGKNAFVHEMGKALGNEMEAKIVFERARWKKAAALALYGELMTTLNTPPIPALNAPAAMQQLDQPFSALMASTSPQARAAVLRQEAPDLQSLFGSMDLCECEHCRSFYSPAAYLVDILHWLAQRPKKDRRSPKDVLLQRRTQRPQRPQRRPDLGDIELSCENTNTVIPYVDLVNEVLEDAIAPPASFTPFNLIPSQNDLPSLVASLDRRDAPAVITAFGTDHPLSLQAVITVQQAGEWWTIAEPAYTYTIRKVQDGSNTVMRVVARSRQTSGTSLERRAFPQYRNERAYKRLRQAAYPWRLPFDLWEAEARTYLEHLGTSRQGLAEAFTPGLDREVVLNDPAIAAQVLGLSAAERLQISGVRAATTASLTALIGELTIDGVTLKAGDWALVKNQPEPTQPLPDPPPPPNGVYLVQNATWQRLFEPIGDGRLIAFVREGDTQRDKFFYLQTPAISGGTARPAAGEQTQDAFWGKPMDLRVRLATTAHRQLAGLGSLEGRSLEEGTLVLVKNQSAKCENGVYRVQNGPWALVLQPTENPIYVSVAVGNQRGRYFRLDRGLMLNDEQCNNKVEIVVTKLHRWPGALTRVDLFLRQSGLGDPQRPETGYGELLELLETRFLNPARDLKIQPAQDKPSDTCALTDLVIQFPESDATALNNRQLKTWDRLHRFVRLARALGWRYRDLDRALTVFAADKFVDDLIVKLSHVRRLQQRLGVPVETILSWWGGLDTAEYTDHAAEGRPTVLSPYDRLFRNPARSNPLDPNFELNAGRDELRDLSVLLIDHAPGVAAALEISVADLELLLPGQPTPELTLANLSHLHRITSLAKALRLSLPDFLAMRSLSSHDTFNGTNTAGTLLFVDAVEQVRAAGFSIAELNYVLRDKPAPTLALAPADKEIADWLADLRGGLRKIADENDATAPIGDPDGALTQAKLSLLSWEPDVVKQTVAMLSGNEVYVQPLAALPAPLTNFPRWAGPFEVQLASLPNNVNLPGFVSYDAVTQKLRANAALTPTERDGLVGMSTDEKYQAAVRDLYAAPTTIGERVSWDSTRQTLVCRGPMTLAMRDSLLLQSNDQPYQDAVRALFEAPRNFARRYLRDFGSTPPPSEVFLSDSDVDSLFDAPLTAEDRFKRVLVRLLPYLAKTLSQNLITQQIAEKLVVEAGVARYLLEKLKPAPDSAENCLAVLREAKFVRSNPDSPITAEACLPQFQAFDRLHKAATIVTRFKLTLVQLKWLMDRSAAPGWLDLNQLPVRVASGQPDLLSGLLRLGDLARLRDRLPGGETALNELNEHINQASGKANYVDTLARWTLWSESDLTALLGAKDDDAQKGRLGVAYPADYDERLLLRLLECFALLKRLGVSAAQAAAWRAPVLTQAHTQGIEAAVKAKYDEAAWLERAPGLRDPLRNRQREALMTYLVANPEPGADGLALWRSRNDLYAHFLIDVEMDACMDTSRIKQAISSAQLFVQRCLLNLEQPAVNADAEQDENWRQWEWMKTYRAWEANRKIFLYPENWIEPELRDDKSPFFKELENELLQNELTTENAETAFLHYLEKLDQVARLEIMGMCQGVEPHIWHVFGRTYSQPHLYYYRRKEGDNWTPWEKVDLDIEGDHMIPVVWNRRLYLFWPLFREKAENVESANGEDKPNRYWEISLAWSEYRQAKWSPKKISESLDFPKDTVWRWLRGRERFYFRAEHADDPPALLVKAYYDWVDAGTSEEEEGHTLSHKFTFKMLAGSAQIIANHVPDESIEPPRNTIPLGKGFEVKASNQPLALDLSGYPILIIRVAPEPYQIVLSSHERDLRSPRSLAFQDSTRVFFAQQAPSTMRPSRRLPDRSLTIGSFGSTPPLGRPDLYSPVAGLYEFHSLYHPYIQDLLARLHKGNVRSLLDPAAQRLMNDQELKSVYGEQSAVTFRPGQDLVDFANGSYALYNWELFFHAPLFIADRLSKNQRFEDARKWFHYIFDPTDASHQPSPQRYWRTKPLHEQAKRATESVPEMLRQFARREGSADLTAQIEAWRDHPFQAHRIARLRTTAYQKTVVMRYIDNLLAWGDQLFRRDTLETLNEATQLYVLAADLLGKRPAIIPPRQSAPIQTYKTLEPALDGLSNALISLEYLVTNSGGTLPEDDEHTPLLDTLAFCVPANDKLLGYWDTVADRLFKLRHCMNIEGVVRRLPLFEPPIDPALLARAAAAGVDLGSVLSDISAPLPHYRFNVMAQKASELASEVKSLGAALLSALEKRDAEELGRLRSTHEIAVLKAVRQVRESQVKEAKASWDSLADSKRVVEERHSYYRDVAFLNPAEIAQMGLTTYAMAAEGASGVIAAIGAFLYLVPETKLGAPTTIGFTIGGSNLGDALNAWQNYFRSVSSLYGAAAGISGTVGSHMRRWDEWKLQERMAKIELDQIADQLVAAEIRHAITEKELENHDLQIENARAVDETMRSKFTNQELYDWMTGQISGLYFQAYQLAYDVAKRAERAFRHELGLQESNYIQFGYWDSLKKGLLAGERLHQDIRRMEVAYLDQNRREHELDKHVSLLQLSPAALIALKETGRCEIDLPEALFDMDFPGHYMRRIKSVGLTIPCVTGPYTGVHCKLTLLKSTLRHRNTLGAGDAYARDLTNDDPRFSDQYDGVQSVVTSSGQNDSGLFEANLRDERYLPFEGAGAISTWRLELPKEFPQFDHDTISDVVLHLRYTARDGGETLRQKTVEHVQQLISKAEAVGMVRLFSVRHEFPSEWAKFQSQQPAANQRHKLTLVLRPEHYPFWSRGRLNKVTGVEIYARSRLGNLLRGPLVSGLPAKPDATLDLFFDDPEMSDLWIAVAWSGN